jgi:hypothetical protein
MRTLAQLLGTLAVKLRAINRGIYIQFARADWFFKAATRLPNARNAPMKETASSGVRSILPVE